MFRPASVTLALTLAWLPPGAVAEPPAKAPAQPPAAEAPAPDLWEGYVHPDPEHPEEYHYVGTHESLAQCRKWAYAVLKTADRLDEGYYECGRNCRWKLLPDGSGVVKRCEEVAQ